MCQKNIGKVQVRHVKYQVGKVQVRHVKYQVGKVQVGHVGKVQVGHEKCNHRTIKSTCNKKQSVQVTMNNERNDSAECRICFEDEKQGQLIRPCLCAGTAKYIHLQCLEQWRTSSVNRNNAFRCDICHYEYRFSRVKIAKFIQNPLTISVFSFLVIAVTVALVAFFIRAFFYLLLGVKLSKSAFSLSGKIVWCAVLVVGFTFALISMLALLGENHNDNAGANGVFRAFFDFTSMPNSTFFEFVGYGFSLTGFAMFVLSVYDYVFYQTTLLLD